MNLTTEDRLFMGWNDSSHLPRTPGRIADELHLLLANAGVLGPYLLVGHSPAGKNIRMTAAHVVRHSLTPRAQGMLSSKETKK